MLEYVISTLSVDYSSTNIGFSQHCLHIFTFSPHFRHLPGGHCPKAGAQRRRRRRGRRGDAAERHHAAAGGGGGARGTACAEDLEPGGDLIIWY